MSILAAPLARPSSSDATSLFADLDERLHLWLVPLADVPDPAWVAANRQVLSEDELARCDRYLRPSDADLFLAAHVAVRRILSRYADVAPADWRFTPGSHGRPEPVAAGMPDGLRCNLTHTPGLTAVLVHDRDPSGVDAELAGRIADPTAMARTVLTADERAELHALPATERPLAFSRVWTLKEAFLKAGGQGLAIPLSSFGFAGFSAGGPLTFTCAPSVDPDPGAWDFTVDPAGPTHVVATATRRDGGRPPRPVEVIATALDSL